MKQAAQTLDWGGVTWGGDYREVVEGLHKNSDHGQRVLRHPAGVDRGPVGPAGLRSGLSAAGADGKEHSK